MKYRAKSSKINRFQKESKTYKYHKVAHKNHKVSKVSGLQNTYRTRKFYSVLTTNLTLPFFASFLPTFALFVLTFVFLSSPHSAYAASSASNTVNISVESGCIISASGNHHAGSITPSTYGQIGGEGSNTTVTIGCNDGNGYTVYAVGYTNDVEGTTELIGKKTSTSSGNNKINTGTAQSGDISNWNFKLFEPTGLALTSTYTNNSSIPDSSTAIATKKASTDPTGYIDSFKVSYYAYISSTQPADTYSGKVKYTVFHNAELIYNYTIHYNLNEGQGGPDPNPQTGKSNTGSVKLSTTEPTKQDYEFMGWCTLQPADNDTDNPTCSGQTYTAGQDYTLGEIDADTTFYAIWKDTKMGFNQAFAAAGKSKQDGYYKMQDMTPEICKNVTIPNVESTVTLIDARDNNTYTVAKLDDGKCWMTQNLRIKGSRLLTSSDSDVLQDFSLPSSVGSTSGSNSSFIWSRDQAYIYVDSDATYGGYYNWVAATAGTGNSTVTSGDAKSSICSKGWRLPTSTEFTTLATKYPRTSLLSPPVNMVRAGLTQANCADGDTSGDCLKGGGSFYWSSTAYSDHFSYKLYSGAGSSGFGVASVAGFGGMHSGYSVRCLADE